MIDAINQDSGAFAGPGGMLNGDVEKLRHAPISRRSLFATVGRFLPALGVLAPGPITGPKMTGWDFRSTFHSEFAAIEFYPPGKPIPPEHMEYAFELDHHGSVVLRPIHRREREEIAALPQQAPIKIDLRPEDSTGDGERALTRHWEPEGARGCKLCASCRAFPSHVMPGKVACMVRVPNAVTEETAPLYDSNPTEASR